MLVEAVVADSGTHVLHQTPDIGETFVRLRRAGLQIGIICDVAITSSEVLRTKLDEGGLLGQFDHWSFNDEVGHYKPSPVVFAHAAEGLGASDPARICHVGDRGAPTSPGPAPPAGTRSATPGSPTTPATGRKPNSSSATTSSS